MENNYATMNKPTIREQLHRLILSRGIHREVEPLFPPYRSGIVIYTSIRFDVRDRIKIFLGGQPEIRTSLVLAVEQKDADIHRVDQTSIIIK